MNELREMILDGHKNNGFLKVIYDIQMGDQSVRDELAKELISLNNEKIIDVVAEFNNLFNHTSVEYDFFMTRRIFEKILPDVESSVLPVMSVVRHLTNEAENDMTAGMLYAPFIEFCKGAISRPVDVLKQAENTSSGYEDFIGAAIISGTNFNLDRYTNEAIRLVSDGGIELKKRAVFVLGNIQYDGHTKTFEEVVGFLGEVVEVEDDDHFLGNVIVTCFKLIKQNKDISGQLEGVITKALDKGRDLVIHSVSDMFRYDLSCYSEGLIEKVIGCLSLVNSMNKGTLDNIDYFIVDLLKLDNPNKGIMFLTSILLNNEGVTIDDFKSTKHKVLSKHDALLNKIVTKWLASGEKILCSGVYEFLKDIHGENVKLSVDRNELSGSELELMFIARKAVGYLFTKPVTCASLMISIMNCSKDNELIGDIGELLFDPLLINYPNKMLDYLNKQKEVLSGTALIAINTSTDALENYLDSIKSIPEMPELWPSQEHREISFRRFSRLMADSYKSAMKGSIVEMITTKSVILYGASSINHIQRGSSNADRMEIPMQSHGTTIDIPRMESIDHYGLDYRLRTFRAEQII